MGDHYLDCTDRECLSCLPTDDEVQAFDTNAAIQEAKKRELRTHGNGARRIAVILDDADDYRARSAAARE